MTEPYPKGTEVELLTSGRPYAKAVIKSRRKNRLKSTALLEAFGPYDYYVMGKHFGTWCYSRDLRPIHSGVAKR